METVKMQQSDHTVLESNQAISMRPEIGTIVCAIAGRVWLTQEGLYRDVVLTSGECFEVTRRGLIVLNALGGRGVVHVAFGQRPQGSCGVEDERLGAPASSGNS